MVDKKDDANLKIADFGFAKKHDAGSEVLRTQCGTPGCETIIQESWNQPIVVPDIGMIAPIHVQATRQVLPGSLAVTCSFVVVTFYTAVPFIMALCLPY